MNVISNCNTSHNFYNCSETVDFSIVFETINQINMTNVSEFLLFHQNLAFMFR